MRILVDTNILISALLWPKSKPAQALMDVARNHTLVLCEQNIIAFQEVLRRKAPEALPSAEIFLEELPYELISAVKDSQKSIRDPKDQPILKCSHYG